MRYRQFSTTFWKDGYITTLSTIERLFFIYLFTNDQVNMCGMYELPDKFILAALDLAHNDLKTMKERFEKDNKYFFYKGWIFIVNFGEHNRFSTADNIVDTFKKEYEAVPIDVKEYFFKTLKLPYQIPIKSTEKVMVSIREMVMVMVSRVGGRVGGRVETKLNEDINPDDIPL